MKTTVFILMNRCIKYATIDIDICNYYRLVGIRMNFLDYLVAISFATKITFQFYESNIHLENPFLILII
jgi:hypothetical protein